MAIVENRSSELGDIMIIKAKVPAVGIVTLASFIDSTVNEDATALFTKEFRYALDGINFTPWTALTNPNLAGIVFTPTDIFVVEYKYTRAGTDPNPPDLEFNNVELTGTFSPSTCGEVYSKSIFAQFFTCTDACVLSWMINVLEKMYEPGTVPKYITRGEQNNEFRQDQDYLEFWKNIAQYFAYIVCYARQWELTSATGNYDILIEYLRNQTFLFCGEENIEELIYVMNNTYDEMRHRGTFEIIKTKADDARPIDGEWHRLYCHLSECTDWYFSAVFNYKIGWVGDQASPLYKGNYRDPNLTKAYEAGIEVLDLANYPKINPSNINIVSDTVNDGSSVSVMEISGVAIGSQSGIGRDTTPIDTSLLIQVSPKCDYEISFCIKQADPDKIFTFILDCYDLQGNLLEKATVNPFFNTKNNTFLSKQKFARSDKYYYVRGIIYNQNHRRKPGENAADYLLNVPPTFAAGWLHDPNLVHNVDYQFEIQDSISKESALKFTNNGVCFIEPRIILDNSDQGDISGITCMYDIHVRPLNTEYSTGFIQASSFIKAKVENFNLNYSNAQADEQVREFLIPYRNTIKTTYLNPSEPVNVDDALDVILSTDERLVSPSFIKSGILAGDRYLVWTAGTRELELQEFDGSSWAASADNAQGKKIFVVNKKIVYGYDSGKWNFSSK